MQKTLLLNSSYETLAFIPLRKLIKLLVKDKVEVISEWDNYIYSDIRYPSIVRLKYYVRRMPMKTRFNRRGIFRRDMYQCQYCTEIVSASKLTLDHVVPTSQGGRSTWENCVTSCLPCNAKKADRTPDQAKMKLLSIPQAPRKTLVTEYILTKPKHDDWQIYFPQVEQMGPKRHDI